MEKYYKNFILCGEADYYCILCKESFIVDQTVEKHLRWEKHRKNIKLQEYVHKFKKDFIYKLSDNNFYCEVCNIVTKNAVDHIKESNHQVMKTSDKNKKESHVFYEENGSIKILNQNATKLQWHGIADNICSTCDEPVEIILAHINSFNHMVKLIQSETVFKDNQNYRKLGNNFYCFSCFKVYETKFLDTHWTGNHCKNKMKESVKENTDKNLKSKDDLKNVKDSIKIKILKKFEKKHFSFDDNKAMCLKCNEFVNITFDAIDEHKKSHISIEDIDKDSFYHWFTDKGKRRAELAKYGKENYIKLNEGGSKGYCSLCDIYLSAHLNTAKQHVEGSYHRGHLELKGFLNNKKHNEPPKSIPYKLFLDVMFGPFEIDDLNLVCINDGICINTLSFMLVAIIDDFKSKKGKCYGCDLTMSCIDVKKHAKTEKHSKIVSECYVLPVVMKGDDEFVRQIRPNLYHCGYCNKVFPFWENMMKHLKTFPHEVQRQKAKFLSCICAKKYLDPSCSLTDIEEYNQLRKLDCF